MLYATASNFHHIKNSIPDFEARVTRIAGMRTMFNEKTQLETRAPPLTRPLDPAAGDPSHHEASSEALERVMRQRGQRLNKLAGRSRRRAEAINDIARERDRRREELVSLAMKGL